MQVFGTFPRLFRAGVFTFWAARLFFFHAKMQDSSSETRVFRSAPGEHFSQRQAPKGPQGDSQDPPRGAKNRCFFSWEAPGLEKVEDSSSETRVQKIPEQRESISIAPFFMHFSVFLAAGRSFLDPPGGSLRRPWRPCWVRRGVKGDFFAPRGAP